MNNPVKTIIVDMYRQSSTRSCGTNSYQGLRIHAFRGLHDFLESKAIEYFKAESKLLDMAAGSGAMSLRMQDLGFNVHSTDYVCENFKLEPSLFIQADLNEVFPEKFSNSFDSIIASEIIEHVENPRHFARECFKLLAPGGRMLLSTPNVETTASMALFIQTGCFLWFSNKNYNVDGHITPLTQWQIQKSFKEAGFEFVWKGYFGKGRKKHWWKRPLKLILLEKCIKLLSTKTVEPEGEVFVAVLEKPQTQ